MKWSIEYYSEEIQNKILSLPSELLARYLRLTDLMLEFGSNLGMPHTKFLEDGLIELRVKGKEGIARIFYCTLTQKRIVMLHSFIKKSNKTPMKEIQTARKRMQEVIKNDTRRTKK